MRLNTLINDNSVNDIFGDNVTVTLTPGERPGVSAFWSGRGAETAGLYGKTL